MAALPGRRTKTVARVGATSHTLLLTNAGELGSGPLVAPERRSTA